MWAEKSSSEEFLISFLSVGWNILNNTQADCLIFLKYKENPIVEPDVLLSVLMGPYRLYPCSYPSGREDQYLHFIKIGAEKGIYPKFMSKLRTEIRPLENTSVS